MRDWPALVLSAALGVYYLYKAPLYTIGAKYGNDCRVTSFMEST